MFRSKLARYNTIGCQEVMPVPVVPIASLPRTLPKPIAQIDPPLFPFPQTPCDPTIIPVEIGTWPPCSNPPPGTILSKETGWVPPGYLQCDGSAVSRITYAKLFAVVGTYFGEGDGTTTFNIPQLTNDCNPNIMYIINYDTRSADTPPYVPPSSGTSNVQILPYPMDFVPPPGTILHNTMNFLPPGYLVCDGSNVARDQYVFLFNMIGIYYGVGDGTTTFTLPNLITNPDQPFQYIIRYDIQVIPHVVITPNLSVSGVNMNGVQTFEFS